MARHATASHKRQGVHTTLRGRSPVSFTGNAGSQASPPTGCGPCGFDLWNKIKTVTLQEAWEQHDTPPRPGRLTIRVPWQPLSCHRGSQVAETDRTVRRALSALAGLSQQSQRRPQPGLQSGLLELPEHSRLLGEMDGAGPM